MASSVTHPPPGVNRDVSGARLTTVRTGGPAAYFARPSGLDELRGLLDWATVSGLEVGVIGSGSNLLIADQGFHGVLIKLDKHLSDTEITGSSITCGGGARLPAVAAAAAAAGLAGLEFGVSIPGTVGGAVRMNANAYGGELARTLDWVEVVSGDGTNRRLPADLGFAYRRSNLTSGEIVTRARFRLRPADPAAVRAALADLRARRRASQPAGIKTFGSTFKNPDDPRAEGATAGQLLERAGCRGLRVGGAGFSAKHANFIENHGAATTAEVVALMELGARRVHECFGVELEPEVQTLGEVTLPARWRER
ncbi:UDP-N-acetylmuramate dehydrogenase [Conexibacter sp. DBS9H8]|uniref:UDP-N-acetylmuramate dehydrogenase n=1 Tax=Conexibacter sp. DBS9H8 TaxID=2937801 RepID=UPI0020100C07|nr:UDP-N-acetylmuramate dehydrogenase [Conexibacter sp. DBS9H8]